MSKGAKTALGILGAIILGKAIHEATDDDDDDDDRRRSPPTSPEPEYPEPEVSKPPAGDPASPPTTDARQPPRVARPPADDMRRTSHVPRMGPCCGGGVTGPPHHLTPGSSKAERRDT